MFSEVYGLMRLAMDSTTATAPAVTVKMREVRRRWVVWESWRRLHGRQTVAFNIGRCTALTVTPERSERK